MEDNMHVDTVPPLNCRMFPTSPLYKPNYLSTSFLFLSAEQESVANLALNIDAPGVLRMYNMHVHMYPNLNEWKLTWRVICVSILRRPFKLVIMVCFLTLRFAV